MTRRLWSWRQFFSKIAVISAGVALAANPALAQGKTAEPDSAAEPSPCLPPLEMGLLTLLLEKMLKPGETFDLKGISPAAMQQIGIAMKVADERQKADWPSLSHFAASDTKMEVNRV